MSEPVTKHPATLFEQGEDNALPHVTKTQSATARANDLPGKEWTKNSISVWSDIRKDSEEKSLGHPAIFPKSLVLRLLESFTRKDQKTVLDPFAGSGSTLLAASLCGKNSIGFEINPEYVALINRRFNSITHNIFDDTPRGKMTVHETDALKIPQYVAPNSVDICITSPPYWDVLRQKRSADSKPIRNYGDQHQDLGCITDYSDFIEKLADVFAGIFVTLKPGAYCLINLMDLRKGPNFYPFHSDLATALTKHNFVWDDLLIWDRRSEYNNMRPLGYPAVFRVNKAHEFILIMQKPRN